MAINKVIYGERTLIDITDTTATAANVMDGYYFYGANGVKVVGELIDGDLLGYGDPTVPIASVGHADLMVLGNEDYKENIVGAGQVGYAKI